MRIKYNGFLLSDATAQLKRFPLPEPPPEEEMAAELAGIERLQAALELECAICRHSLTLHTSKGFCEVCVPLNGPCRYRAAKEEALDEKPVPFSSPSLEPSYNELMLEKQRRKRR